MTEDERDERDRQWGTLHRTSVEPFIVALAVGLVLVWLLG